jgi:four helix bundle protein
MSSRPFDLADRLLDFSVQVIRVVEQLADTHAGRHIGAQLLRSGTSPCANHAQAQAAESPRDFVHKMRVALKELRETEAWLKLIRRVPLLETADHLNVALRLNDELIRVFVASIRTAEQNRQRTDG